MANADQAMTDAPTRLAKVETNIRWIASIGSALAMLVIASLSWVSVQVYETRTEHGERLAIIETRLAGIDARLDSLEAKVDRIEATQAEILATLARIESRLSE